MSEGRYNILFLSNRNSARSIFAEAVANRLGGRHFTGFSAGIRPAKDIDPPALDIFNLAHYPTAGLRPKSWGEFAIASAPALDFVFTLCNPAVGEPSHAGLDGPCLPIGATPILKVCRVSNGSAASNWLGYSPTSSDNLGSL
jgi:Low molecular weight phosphotyrosine protein phosphatase